MWEGNINWLSPVLAPTGIKSASLGEWDDAPTTAPHGQGCLQDFGHFLLDFHGLLYKASPPKCFVRWVQAYSKWFFIYFLFFAKNGSEVCVRLAMFHFIFVDVILLVMWLWALFVFSFPVTELCSGGRSPFSLTKRKEQVGVSLWVTGYVCVKTENHYDLSLKTEKCIKKTQDGPGWCGSMDWAPACEPKGCWFDSRSGHIPGLQATSPVGGTQKATTHWPFSLPHLPLSLKINKIFF